MLLVCFLVSAQSPSTKALASFFADVIDNWSVQDDQSGGTESSDLQVAKLSSSAFTMAHKMGLAKISRSSKSGVYNTKYYISGEKSNYNWLHDATTSTVYSSTTFANQTNKPYVSSDICYYIFDSSVSISSDNEYTTDDNGNGWTLSSLTAGSGEVAVKTAPAPTMTAKTWTAYTIAVGDVLYSDGALSHYGSSIYSSRTAIAVVFNVGRGYSGDPSAWTHGYALALREFNYCAWSSTQRQVGTYLGHNYANLIADMAGYTKTVAITKVSGFSSSTFPAAYKAWNYSARSKNGQSTISLSSNLSTVGAHWFLPSSGQLYLLIKNLGGVTTTPTNGTNQFQWANSTDNTRSIRDRINAYITPIISAGYTTSTVSPKNVNLETENIAVRIVPAVTGIDYNADNSKIGLDNTYKSATETGSNTVSTILWGLGNDLCITSIREGEGYSKTDAGYRDGMRPIIGF